MDADSKSYSDRFPEPIKVRLDPFLATSHMISIDLYIIFKD